MRPRPRIANRRIVHGRRKPTELQHHVERGQRVHAVGVADRPLEADRAADVVHDQVAAVDLERVDRLAGPAGQARPRVVEVGGPIGEAEAREVERDRRAKPCWASTGITLR